MGAKRNALVAGGVQGQAMAAAEENMQVLLYTGPKRSVSAVEPRLSADDLFSSSSKTACSWGRYLGSGTIRGAKDSTWGNSATTKEDMQPSRPILPGPVFPLSGAMTRPAL